MSDLQQRMAAIIDGVIGDDCEHYGLERDPNAPGGCKPCHEYAKRIAERLMPAVREAQAESLKRGFDDAHNQHTAHRARRNLPHPPIVYPQYRSNDE